MCKKLSYMLRHGAINAGLHVRSDGFVKVNDLLSHKDFRSFTIDSLQTIVLTDEKNRYSLQNENGTFYIRANQGHSHIVGKEIKDDVLLKQITSPIETCFHATYKKYLESIKKTGLKVMNRKHIHMATSLDSKSGKRSNCDTLIYIDMKKAMKDDIIFYRSENDVVLTCGINGVLSPQYFRSIVDTDV
jgi:2'-phosphotransferase